MTRPLALDLFCGAGGVSMGLWRAGFQVLGVDHKPQPRYPFRFIQGNALEPEKLGLKLSRFAFVWASPPCQAHSILNKLPNLKAEHRVNLIPETRELLEKTRALTCIENVPGAPLRADLVLTGGEFDLDIIRRRHFELRGFSAFIMHRQQLRKVTDGGLASVAGHGANNAWNVRRKESGRTGKATKWRDLPEDLKRRLLDRNNAGAWQAAMGIDWMTRGELAQAIPPAYAEFIGRAALEAIDAARAA